MAIHANPEMQMSEAMRSAGIQADETITGDGKLHRFHIVGEPKKNKRDGWYVLYLDGSPFGLFGSWKTNERHEWSAEPDKALTPAEIEQNKARMADAKKARDIEYAKLKEAARLKAAKLWASSGLVNAKHAYLVKKGIRAVGIKQLRQSLVIPVSDVDGQMRSLQFITEDGSKRFLTGGKKNGCFALLGEPEEELCIAEGYATGASIYEATGCAVAVAFDAGNLLPVAKALRERYPNTKLIICADDDAFKPENVGLTRANEAAAAVNGLLAIPDFGENRPEAMTDFNDLHQLRGADAVTMCIASAFAPNIKSQKSVNQKTSKTKSPPIQNEVQDTWPPMLLPSSIKTPDISASILPSWAGAMVDAVAKDTQTPPAASVLLALSTLATCVQRRFEVAPYGDSSHTEPLCIWTLSALPSGSRKTSILSSLSKPLKRWEKLLADRTRSSIASNEAARRVAKKRIEKLETDAAKAKDSNERQNIRDEITREIEETPEEIHAPRLVTGDVTPERLQELLVEQKERLTLMSDEAGIFLVLGGMYSGGQANLDIFLQAYSGSSVTVDRKSRKAYLEKPALTFGLAIQPDVLQDVANNKRFHDSGLLARFLYCLPQSTVGTRDVRARNPIPDDVAQAWHDGLHDLLVDAEKRNVPPRVMHFTSEATDIWLDFAQKVENELSVGGALSQFTEWGAKLAGQAARVAGLIQITITGRNSDRVELDAVRRSIELMGLLVRHAKSTFQLLGADPIEADSIALMAWIKANGLEEVERSRIQRELSGRFRTVSRLKDAAERLAEWNVLSSELMRKNKGARATPYYQVNPKLFSS